MAKDVVKKIKAPVVQSKPAELEQDKKSKTTWARTVNHNWLTDKTYEYDDSFQPSGSTNFWEAKTVHDVVRVLEANPEVQIDAKCIGYDRKSKAIGMAGLNRTKFLEGFKKGSIKGVSLREADQFAATSQAGFSNYNDGNVGDDFISLLGGPFNKQLYLYDYQRMHSLAFFAYHHDPIARFIINTMTDFALGRGFRVDVIGGKDKNFAAPLWKLTEEVNDLPNLMQNFCNEIGIYGEVMNWQLPDMQTKIGYQDYAGQEPKKGIAPRFRPIDPSSIWEIITYPEDITRVLAYQQIAPTQYQMYTGVDAGKPVTTLKYLYQQIAADQIDHYKINCVSNEKRGRSDLFPILGYLKRMRDSINYSIIGDMKNSAWSMDTTIDGDQDDIDAYVENQAAMGTIPPAGSEFVHSQHVTRQYLANAGAKSSRSSSFEWTLSMIAIGCGIPVSYFGSHLSGGQTRASALVSTEPFTKRIEKRQTLLKRIISDMFNRTMKQYGFDAVCEITFPDVVVQDRTAKLKDLVLAETQKWVSKERAAEIASKELNITDYDYKKEQEAIAMDKTNAAPPPGQMSPLTAPAGVPAQGNPLIADKPEAGGKPPHAITSADKEEARRGRGF